MIPVSWVTPQSLRQCLQASVVESANASGVPVTQFPSWRQAAVLISVFPGDEEPQLLLTRRAQHLRHHPGQVSFPGGALEDVDQDVFDAAIREAEEEVGLQLSREHVLGQLPNYRTISGFEVTPVVAWLEQAPSCFVLDESEVAEAFIAPAARLLSPHVYNRRDVAHEGQSYTIFSTSWAGHTVWGATAAMLVALGARLQAIADTD
jgi:8-oxo-dGTP pyrophosphatase MutT (NUDIX family)